MIHTHFRSDFSGPNVLILGSIHGNEHSGSLAIKRCISQILSGELELLCGSVTFMPDCNPEAMRKNVRCIEDNLNRCFYTGQNKQSYEGALAREIMPFFEGKTHLLDLHSTSGPSIPFLFSEKRNAALARKLGVPYVVVGWNDLGSDSIAGDTENYMNMLGGAGFTFEAGNHESPDGEKNAYQVLLNFLSTLGIIRDVYFKSISDTVLTLEMTSVHVCESGNFEFSLHPEQLKNFTPLTSGTLIGIDGERGIRLENDAILVMPSLRKVRRGEDVFFLGREE